MTARFIVEPRNARGHGPDEGECAVIDRPYNSAPFISLCILPALFSCGGTMRNFWAAIILISFLGADAVAQSTNATVGGTVSDGTGALIPGVTVTATNVGTGVV